MRVEIGNREEKTDLAPLCLGETVRRRGQAQAQAPPELLYWIYFFIQLPRTDVLVRPKNDIRFWVNLTNFILIFVMCTKYIAWIIKYYV